ncbi:MAG: HAD hydrolase family protein [Gammaproteobacteria bacterium]|nr:HAD hydrolase family protein [Gammaproteobacteria bacterium]
MNAGIETAIKKAKNIKVAIFDVDGVLTDGKIYFTSSGLEYKAFHSQDGLGIKMLLRAGIEIAIITARTSELVQRRMDELGVRHVFQGQENKIISYDILKNTLGVNDDQIAYVGDDLNDVAPIKRSGFGIAVANASPFVHQHADWSTSRQGGSGAVREVCEFILNAQDLLAPLCEQYL